MRTVRIYQPIKLFTNLIFELTPEAMNHLRVLRFSVGDDFIVFNGESGEYSAKIIAIEKQRISAQIGEYKECLVESPLKIHLGQAVTRGDKMDYTIQKAVELGVNVITPLLTERCGVKLSNERWEKKLQHWRGIIIAACEQSGRDDIPVIASPMLLAQWLMQAKADLQLVLHPQSTKKLDHLAGKPKSIDLLIGPEGGFDESEINLAQRQKFISLQLGPRILRTETAALVAVTALQCYWGDLKTQPPCG